jgi:phosphoribosylanthranilate isomerase
VRDLSASVKICGLRSLDALETAISAGASHFGLVFFDRSPRNIGLQEAAALSRAGQGRITSVALVVDAADDELSAIMRDVAPDMLQLHGKETPERVADIRKRFDRPVIKAIGVAAPGDAEKAETYASAADLILFDAKPPAGGIPGGNGLAFDWRLLAPVKGKRRFMLSGGLTPANVAEAISRTGAALVDVSSGVESAPGVKDLRLIRAFVAAAHDGVPERDEGLWRRSPLEHSA